MYHFTPLSFGSTLIYLFIYTHNIYTYTKHTPSLTYDGYKQLKHVHQEMLRWRGKQGACIVEKGEIILHNLSFIFCVVFLLI